MEHPLSDLELTERLPDTPEADAEEQAMPAGNEPAPAKPNIGVEVPEADAIEQTQPAPLDEEDAPR